MPSIIDVAALLVSVTALSSVVEDLNDDDDNVIVVLV